MPGTSTSATQPTQASQTAAANMVGDITKRMGSEMRQLPVGEMIQSIAASIAEAQATLDKKGIEQFKAMASPDNAIDLGDGIKRPLLALGFSPQFYYFQKATIEVSFEVKFHYDQEQNQTFGVSTNLTLGASRGTQQPGATTTPPASTTNPVSGVGNPPPAPGGQMPPAVTNP